MLMFNMGNLTTKKEGQQNPSHSRPMPRSEIAPQGCSRSLCDSNAAEGDEGIQSTRASILLSSWFTRFLDWSVPVLAFDNTLTARFPPPNLGELQTIPPLAQSFRAFLCSAMLL